MMSATTWLRYNISNNIMIIVSLYILCFIWTINVVNGYPMIMEIPEASERCLRLNIPEDDDANMVFLAFPSPTYDEEGEETPKWITKYNEMETHFFSQMVDLTKKRTRTAIARKFPVEPSDEIQSAMDSFIEHWEGEAKAGCQIKISNPQSSSSRTLESFWFAPVVVNHIRKAIRTNKEEREASPLEGYTTCFQNINEDFPVHMVVDSVMTSEELSIGDDVVASEDEPIQGSHLAPLAEQLSESLAAAKSVIKEMNYMERRESRMRLTAESINARVRYFSYISVGILLVVTYVQVTYLKRYFRKKKLL